MRHERQNAFAQRTLAPSALASRAPASRLSVRNAVDDVHWDWFRTQFPGGIVDMAQTWTFDRDVVCHMSERHVMDVLMHVYGWDSTTAGVTFRSILLRELRSAVCHGDDRAGGDASP